MQQLGGHYEGVDCLGLKPASSHPFPHCTCRDHHRQMSDPKPFSILQQPQRSFPKCPSQPSGCNLVLSKVNVPLARQKIAYNNNIGMVSWCSPYHHCNTPLHRRSAQCPLKGSLIPATQEQWMLIVTLEPIAFDWFTFKDESTFSPTSPTDGIGSPKKEDSNKLNRKEVIKFVVHEK